MLRSPHPFQLQDYGNHGCPDLSYHSDGAWKMDFSMNRGFLGMYYFGAYAGKKENLYVAWNFQTVSQKFALPGGMKWKLLLNTAAEPAVLEQPEELGHIREFQVEEHSVCLLRGEAFSEEKPRRRRKKAAEPAENAREERKQQNLQKARKEKSNGGT